MARILASPLSRRTVLRAGAVLLAAPALSRCASLGQAGPNPFTLGVASGEPAPDGFVLWTRLAPEPLSPDPERPGGMAPSPVAVEWEVAEDESMRRIVRRGTIEALAGDAHSVHVEVGGLGAARPYWYRFRAAGHESAIGRALTAPPPGARAGRLRFAFASCANWQVGYFAAYRRLAEEQPDLVLFLGDYIYEYIERRRPVLRAHSDGVEATDLRTYRNRYAQYKTDPALQAAHAAAPALVTWDDHEVQNDYANRWSQDLADPQAFLRRRAAAYQAFWEHMPLRPSTRPRGPDERIYREFRWGDLARFWMLDERQYRSRPACYGPPFGGGRLVSDRACPERRDPARTMLGSAQERWLEAGLRPGIARWNLIAQGVMMASLAQQTKEGERGYWTDGWDGYPAARSRLLRQLAESRADNPVVLSGDIHSFWANDLRLDFEAQSSPTVATEFVCTSITSTPPPYDEFKRFADASPWTRYFESRWRGYVTAELTMDRMSVAFRAISDREDPNATVSTLKRFVVEDRRPGGEVA
jgi:alkaline phosphatase D